MLYAVIGFGTLVCAACAMRASRLLSAALWLAGVSVLTAILLYLIGATLMSIIELSLSVGLITILLVFAISMVGADSPDKPALHPIKWLPVIVMLLLVVGLTLPFLSTHTTETPESSFTLIFWSLRQADVLAQIALIFAGVMGVLALLAEPGIQLDDTQQADLQQDVEQCETSEAVSKSEPELETI